MALVVETGAGLATAESYASVAEADAYFATFGNEAWSQTEVEQREVALRKATRDLDLMYASTWDWYPVKDDQALRFPRLTTEGVPVNLKRAAIELAGMILQGYEPFAYSAESEVAEKTVKVDVIELRTKYVTDRRVAPELYRIRLILGSLIASETNVGYARVVRG